MYRIAKWNEIFENADSRKRQRLGYYCCPSGNDSQGYIELMSLGQDGINAYAVFLAICQWSATCLPPIRGLLAKSNGKPLTARQIAATIRMPLDVVEPALELLASEDVAWIETVKTELKTQSADNLPVACQSSASHLPVVCHKDKDKGKDKDKDKDKTTSSRAAIAADVVEKLEFLEGQEMAAIEKANRIHREDNRIAIEQAWLVACVDEITQCGVFVDLLGKLRRDEIRKPRQYVRKTLINFCNENGHQVSRLESILPKMPKKKTAIA